MKKSLFVGLLMPVLLLCVFVSCDIIAEVSKESTDYDGTETETFEEENYDDIDSLRALKFTELPDGTYSVKGDHDGMLALARPAIVVIPESYEGKPVTVIGEAAFHGMFWIETVVIPDTVTVLEKKAFAGCERLEKIVSAKGVKTIGSYAFSQCPSLTKVTLHEGAEEIQTGLPDRFHAAFMERVPHRLYGRPERLHRRHQIC